MKHNPETLCTMGDTAWYVFFLVNPLEIFLGVLSLVQTRVVVLRVSLGNEENSDPFLEMIEMFLEILCVRI
jgi:hypothetical protein